MNGTIIDIQNINVSVTPIELQDSTDKAYVVVFKDSNDNEIIINISYGIIQEVRSSIK